MRLIYLHKTKFNLDELIDFVNEKHEPILVSGKGNSAVLLSQAYWASTQETLCLLSVPGMRESIVKGMKEPLSKTSIRIAGW